ncbi:fungal-specific transcription factor domain-containing protein [Aspergillus cavernicola]|uniref:Fungal-specific transcription factor domain-containing protein n=1 Tax=Aspergillus cavernicola TaxID=176166 RepID=A0ABR4IEU3_9EURO
MVSGRKTPRASVACAKCRQRKVRCDVARRGHPCMNCELDQEECVVLPRGRQQRRRLETAGDEDASPCSSSLSSPDGERQRRTFKKGTRPTDITFQAYTFIKTEFLSRLEQDEICYLDSQSCFRLPVRSSWQSMLQVYFQHINPLVPVLDETTFWRLSRGNETPTVSLFVAQAILFAACPFASRRTIKGLGFANCRNARAAFYRRAKLLYRLESELHSVAIVQGSLLLSLCSSAQTESPVNSVWLSIAVQHARSLGAHHFEAQGTASSSDWRELKRLWWVCLIRDRIIALGHRRPLQIVYDHWDIEIELLSSSKVSEEMCQSEVYSAPFRHGLFSVFRSVFGLCVPLTQILQLAVPESENCSAALRQADIFSDSLQVWLDETNGHLERFYQTVSSDEPVVLHDHLLQIYFHAAQVHIHNFKIKTIASLSRETSLRAPELLRSGSGIETSVDAIANSLSILAQHQLVQYIPTSAVMCVVFPFVLDAVYLEGVPHADQSEASNKHNETFLESMRALRTRYNYVDPITNVVDKVLSLIKPCDAIPSWKQLIASRPGYYIALLRTVDLVLSTGRLPSGAPVAYTLGSESEVSVADPTTIRFCSPELLQECSEVPDSALELSDDSLYQSNYFPVESPLELGAQMVDSRPSDPFLRDIFGLCQDQDIETLLGMV